MGILRRFNRDEYGATAVEYIVALILCCMVVLGISKLFGETIRAKFMAGQNEISEMDSEEVAGGGDGKTGKSLGAKAAAGGTSPRTGDSDDGAGQASGAGAGARSGGAGSGSKGGGGGGKSGGARASKGPGDKSGSVKDPGGYVEGFDEEKKAGFNPLFLLIFLGLGGMLLFIMYKGNRGQ